VGIPVTVILDSAVGYIMERVREAPEASNASLRVENTSDRAYRCVCVWAWQVSVVILGAEGVVESGGIVNKVRT
jgi:translation initiation factor 2B subunit (eIF-2B alpha/beta/delta family)